MTPGGTLGELKAVDDFLTGLVVDDAVLELVAQVGQAEEGFAAGGLESGHAGEGDFQGDGDLALDLFGGAPGNWATTSTMAGAGSG